MKLQDLFNEAGVYPKHRDAYFTGGEPPPVQQMKPRDNVRPRPPFKPMHHTALASAGPERTHPSPAFSLKKKVQEVLDRPLPGKWEDHGNLIAKTFIVAGMVYKVIFSEKSNSSRYEVSFSQQSPNREFKPQVEITGTGHQYEVYSTVLDALREFIEIHHPVALGFKGSVAKQNHLYQKFLKHFALPTSYKFKVTDDGKVYIYDQSASTFKNFVGRFKPSQTETIRRPHIGVLSSDYEVRDREETIGIASVADGVIVGLSVNNHAPQDFHGQILSKLLGTIIREADQINANLSIQVIPEEMNRMKELLTRFGFRHVGGGVFKRNAGATRPPSVIQPNPTWANGPEMGALS